ncbi:TonB-dependent receptor family protein [Caenimonas terrae]|uniref:TonB-dependent receptor family protein n=1 Tax=Caenimonas terrae TaxID=696074 RepID=A0ABW0NGG6_9BURK
MHDVQSFARRCGAPALLAAAMLPPGAAIAQPQPQPPVREGLLSPVVISVTRGVEQRAFDTPASVDVVDAAVIRDAGPQVNLSEALSRVPGVVALNRQNYAQDIQISSRGFGARSTFGVRGLRLYVDGIPATGPDGQGQVSHFDLASAARIEVLRGPFSALYGNSSGGVISMFTADGGPQTIGEIGTAFGSDGLRRTGLKLGGQQGALQYNLSASRFETDGSRQHSAAERTGFNGKVKYTLDADTRWTFVLNSVRMPDVQDPLGLTRAELQADPRRATPAALTFNTRKSIDQTQGGVVLDHRFNPGNALQVTAYVGERATQQFQSIPVATQTPASHPGGVIDLARDYSGIDARWIRKSQLLDEPLTFTAGVSMERLQEDRRGFQNFVGSTLGVLGALRRDEANDVRSTDEYAQAEWAPGRWRISAGVRHSQVSFDSRDHYVVPGNPDDSGSVSYSATSPVLGLVFRASDDLNLYASLGKGFETPTLNELAYRPSGATGLNLNLRSAGSRQWELGVKSQFGKDWALNAAYFRARTSDEIAVLANTGGRSVYQNVGSTSRDGVEAVLSGRWQGGWSAYASASYLDAIYRDSFLTCTSAPCAKPTTRIAAGNRIPGIPASTLYAEVAWAHRPWGLETALEWRRLGRIYVDDGNTDAAPASSVFNLRVSLAQQVGRWALREFLRVDNIADRSYVGSVIVNEGNSRFFEPAPGRTWLLGLNAAYQF